MEQKNDFYFEAPDARVLLVDDNEMNITVAKLHLSPLHMQIETARNGVEALDMMENNRYDLVFMDQMMPEMDGCEATTTFRMTGDSYHEMLPIICVTANAQPGIKCKCREAGFNDFLEKPLKSETIVAATREWLPQELIVPSDVPAVSKVEEERVPVPEIAGIHSEEGIECAGSITHWMDLLGDFYRIIDLKTELIEACMRERNAKRYTTEVHGLKSTARMIGATELSEEFLLLEELGDRAEWDEILRKTPIVLKHFNNFKERLLPYADPDEETGKTEASTADIIEVLQNIYDAIDGFDIEEADAQMNRLRTYSVPDEITDRIRKLDAYMADVDMEAVMSESKDIIEVLKNK